MKPYEHRVPMRGVEFRLLSPLAGVWTPRVTPELQSLGRRPSGWSRLLSVREVAARLGSAPRRPTSSAPKESSSTQGSRTRFVSRKRFFEPIARDSGPGSGPSTSRNPAWSIIGMGASSITAASPRCAGAEDEPSRSNLLGSFGPRLGRLSLDRAYGRADHVQNELGLGEHGTWLESTSIV